MIARPPKNDLRLATPDETRPTPKEQRANPLVPAIIIIVVFIIRILTRAKYMFYLSSFAFAVGTEAYNPALLHPQPPGYPAFVGLTKLLLFSGIDHCLAMELISALASGVACAYLFLLIHRLSTTNLALTMTSAFAFNPIFWYYGANPLTYALSSAFACAVAYHLWLAGSEKTFHFPLACALTAIGGAFRQDIALFMLPLLIWGGWRLRRYVKTVLLGGVLFLALNLSWFIPVLTASGGWGPYFATSSKIFSRFLSTYSVFFGGERAISIVMKVFGWTVVGAILPLSALLITPFLKDRSKPQERRPLPLSFILTWLIPPLAFFLLLYIASAGYLLIVIPAFYLLCALVWHRRGMKGLTVHILMTAGVILGAGIFMGVNPQSLQAPTIAENLTQLRLNKLVLQFSYSEINKRDSTICQLAEILGEENYKNHLILCDHIGCYPDFAWRDVVQWYSPQDTTVASFSRFWDFDPPLIKALDENYILQEYHADHFPLQPQLYGHYIIISDIPFPPAHIFDVQEILNINRFVFLYRIETTHSLSILLDHLEYGEGAR